MVVTSVRLATLDLHVISVPKAKTRVTKIFYATMSGLKQVEFRKSSVFSSGPIIRRDITTTHTPCNRRLRLWAFSSSLCRCVISWSQYHVQIGITNVKWLATADDIKRVQTQTYQLQKLVWGFISDGISARWSGANHSGSASYPTRERRLIDIMILLTHNSSDFSVRSEDGYYW